MASVTSYTDTKIDALLAPLVESAAIADDGTLTVTTQDGTILTIGIVQQVNDELSDISGLSPTNDDLLQRKAGHWTNRTIANVIADLLTAGLIDTTATHIQPIGLAAVAGNQGAAADAKHVHAGISTVAATALAGWTMTTGTPTILSWTAPNDGKVHNVTVGGSFYVTSATTGGQINVTYTVPSGAGTRTDQMSAATQATGSHPVVGYQFAVEPNTTVTIAQESSMSAGAAKFWGFIQSD